jgi:hypothetical protein
MSFWLAAAALLGFWGQPVSGGHQAAETAKLLASDGGGYDVFGWDVDVHGDYAIIGACADDEGGGTDGGAAFIFYFDGSNWGQQAKIVAGDSHANDMFGRSVAIYENYAVIGACYGDNQEAGISNCGTAYVYKRSGATWTFQDELYASDGQPGDQFGESIDICGDWIIVGAYRAPSGNNPEVGAAYVFQRSGETWTQMDKLEADSDRHAGDWFGADVAISPNYAIVGAPRYDDPTNGTDSGAAFLFERDDTDWDHVTPRLAEGATDDQFGCAVAIDNDSVAVVGAETHWPAGCNRTGAAYVYLRGGSSWPMVQKLHDTAGAHWDRFGCAVAICDDGIVIGAKSDDTGGNNHGSAYLYVRDGGTWVEEDKMYASDGEPNDEFGEAVALYGSVILIGARYEDALGTDAGAAYTFEITFSFCPGDFDDDGDIDTADLLFLLGAWGTPDGDVDGDGDTDTADLLALLGAWGQCP